VGYNNANRSVQHSKPLQHWQPSKRLDSLSIWRDNATVGEGVNTVAYKTDENKGAKYNMSFDLGNGGINEECWETCVKLFARILHPLLFKDDISDKEAGLPDPDQYDYISGLSIQG
jgi:hypothetical protein